MFCLSKYYSNSKRFDYFAITGKLMKQSDNEEEMAKINKDKLHFLFRIYDDDGRLVLSYLFH